MIKVKQLAAGLGLVTACALFAMAFVKDRPTALLAGITPTQAPELRLIETKLTQNNPFSEVMALHLENEEGRQIVLTLDPEIAANTTQQKTWSESAAILAVTETEIGAAVDKIVVMVMYPSGSNDLGNDLLIETYDAAQLRQHAGTSPGTVTAAVE